MKVDKTRTIVKQNKHNILYQYFMRVREVIITNMIDSLGTASPRPSKVMEKYKTYIQFITNNKITNDSYQISK